METINTISLDVSLNKKDLCTIFVFKHNSKLYCSIISGGVEGYSAPYLIEGKRFDLNGNELFSEVEKMVSCINDFKAWELAGISKEHITNMDHFVTCGLYENTENEVVNLNTELSIHIFKDETEFNKINDKEFTLYTYCGKHMALVIIEDSDEIDESGNNKTSFKLELSPLN